MAHECPDCGQTCYCHGDIDDCIFDNSEEQAVCDHCPFEGYDDEPDRTVSEGIYGEENIKP